MHIWLISIFEQTPVDNVFSTRFLSIGEEAHRRGHEVMFVASTFKHNTKTQRFDATTELTHKPNYKLLFVRSIGYKGNISFKRLWSHFSFANSLITELNKHKPPDIILIAYPPVDIAYKVSQWARTHNIPVVLDIIDPWPDSFKIVLPNFFKPFLNLILGWPRFKLRKALSNISGVTSISRQYLDWCFSYSPVIPFNEVFYPAVEQAIIEEAISNHTKANRYGFRVIYAGSLGFSYDIPCILRAASILSVSHPEIVFTIVGAGPQQALIEQYCINFRNLEFKGRVSKADLMKLYAASDLGLTQHISGATQSVTYKLFDLLAAGLPILNSLESEMKDIILHNRVGLHNEPGDALALAKNIIWFYEHPAELAVFRGNGIELTRKYGNAPIVYSRFVDLLEQVKFSKSKVK